MKKMIMTAMAVLASALLMNASAQYKVGDVYDKDGVKGVVFSVDASGQHGLVVHPNIIKGRWCKNELKKQTDAFDANDGEKNMMAIEKCIQETGKTWEDFPIFQAAHNIGEGWYIPAKAELEALVKAVNGGSMTYDKKSTAVFAKSLKKAGGKKMFIDSNMLIKICTSTELEGGDFILTLDFKSKTGAAVVSGVTGFGPTKGDFIIAQELKNANDMGIKHTVSVAVHKF